VSSCLCCHIGSEGLLYDAVSVSGGMSYVSSCLCCHIGSEGLLYDAERDLLAFVVRAVCVTVM